MDGDSLNPQPSFATSPAFSSPSSPSMKRRPSRVFSPSGSDDYENNSPRPSSSFRRSTPSSFQPSTYQNQNDFSLPKKEAAPFGRMQMWKKIAIVGSGIVGFILVGCLAWWLWKEHTKNNQKTSSNNNPDASKVPTDSSPPAVATAAAENLATGASFDTCVGKLGENTTGNIAVAENDHNNQDNTVKSNLGRRRRIYRATSGPRMATGSVAQQRGYVAFRQEQQATKTNQPSSSRTSKDDYAKKFSASSTQDDVPVHPYLTKSMISQTEIDSNLDPETGRCLPPSYQGRANKAEQERLNKALEKDLAAKQKIRLQKSILREQDARNDE